MADQDQTLQQDREGMDQGALQNAPVPPIGLAMAVPGATGSQPANAAPPPVPAAMPLPNNSPAAVAPVQQPAMQVPQQVSASQGLLDRAKQVKNPFERILAEAGSGVLRGLDVGAESLFPGPAMRIPGSQLNTNLRNQQAYDREEKQQAMDVERLKADSAAKQAGAEQERADTEAYKAKNPSQKEAKELTPEESAIHDLMTGENGMPRVNPATGKPYSYLEAYTATKQAGEKPASDDKTPPHITIMGPDKQPHIMERDPKTGEYSVDRGVAPPSYAQVAPSLRTVDVIDPNTGLPTVETLTGKQLGTSATGAYGHEMEQAGAVSRDANDLINDINSNRDIMGKLDSYIKQGTLGTPIADQKAAYMLARLRTFAALQPAMHAFRSASAMEAFEKLIGGLANNPDATIATIRGITKTAGAINPNAEKNAPNVGEVVKGYRFKGGDPSDQKNWEKVNGGR